MQIPVSDVGKIVADLSLGFEARNGAFTAMEASRKQFEHWWKGELFLAFARDPWNRVPGRLGGADSAVGVSMESTWLVTDQRRKYSTDKRARGGRAHQNRVDLAVRATQRGEQFHLLELKLFDRKKPGWPVRDQVHSIEHDMLGLQSLDWDITASGWSIVLGLRFDDEEEFYAHVESAGSALSGLVPIERYRLTDSVWMAARRAV